MSRDLRKYPITPEEVLATLQQAVASHDGEIGGQQAYILGSLHRWLSIHRGPLERITASMHIGETSDITHQDPSA